MRGRVGSTIATSGSIEAARRLAFRPNLFDFNTAFLVASLPGPLVVGTAIYGSGLFLMGRPLPMTSRWSKISPGLVTRAATDLPRSIAEPPPTEITASHPIKQHIKKIKYMCIIR